MNKPSDIPDAVWEKASILISFGYNDTHLQHCTRVDVARAIVAAESEGREAMRQANLLIQNKNREANHQLGKALQAKNEAERRERVTAANKDEWKSRALEAEAKLHSIGFQARPNDGLRE